MFGLVLTFIAGVHVRIGEFLMYILELLRGKDHVLRVLLEFLRFYFENRSSMELNLC